MTDRIVAYRHKLGERYTGTDKEIVCKDCHTAEDRPIVLRSENGARIKANAIPCTLCGKQIRIGDN